MKYLALSLTAVLTLAVAQAEEPKKTVAARIETTWKTAGEHIRQFAFDGDETTYFATDQKIENADHFTLIFGQPVGIKSVHVMTGKPDGSDKLDSGSLQVSSDGVQFDSAAQFSNGVAQVGKISRECRAIRIRADSDLNHPLAIREIKIESDPPVVVFRYPVEFVVNVDDAPEMKDWAEKAARICTEQYPMINEELRSPGYKPATVVRMTFKNDYRGVAATSRSGITGSVKYFKEHPDDFGAMVHETVHVVQRYRTRDNPGWLVEGIADYIRFFKFEPGKLRKLSPERAKYDGSYRVTAQFLAYVAEKYDREIVRKLNQAMREGDYNSQNIWGKSTKKGLAELGEEWKESLKPKDPNTGVSRP
jgi:hypothetical protein